MSLIPNWKDVLTKAWSVRLIALAAVLSGAEAILPMYVDRFPHELFTALSGLLTSGALVARLVAQKTITPAEKPNG